MLRSVRFLCGIMAGSFADMAGVEDAMRQIVTEFRKGAYSYLAET